MLSLTFFFGENIKVSWYYVDIELFEERYSEYINQNFGEEFTIAI
jgi:hypothetical protein